MSRLLQWIFGRLPIGWMQLTHKRGRFFAALSGVAFANVLVFVQLGIMNSMATATLRPYEFFKADIMISATDANGHALAAQFAMVKCPVRLGRAVQSIARCLRIDQSLKVRIGDLWRQRPVQTQLTRTSNLDPSSARRWGRGSPG
jgi:hypothetical protein